MNAIKELRFTSPAERKQFDTGMAIVAAKLAKAHVATAQEREATTIKQGRLAVLKKLGSAGYRKTFGVAPPAVAAKVKVPVRPSPSRAPAPPAGKRVLTRHFSVARGLF